MNCSRIPPADMEPNNLVERMSSFWRDNFRVVPWKNGYAVAYPLLMPDGMQLTFYINPVSEKRTLLTDMGKTHAWLESMGLNPGTPSTHALLREKAKLYEITYNHTILEKETTTPPSPLELQLYAEGLISIAQLSNRIETAVPTPAETQMTIAQILQANKIPYKTSHELNAGYERKLRVDFCTTDKRRAVQIIDHKNGAPTQMEIWAYRAKEITLANENLRMALVYNEDRLTMTSGLTRLVQGQCPYVFPSSKTDEIESFLVA